MWALRAPGANWSSVVCSADGNQLVAVVNGGGIYKSQSTPPPVLSLAPSAGDLLLSWIVPSMNLVLQENPDLATTNWTAVTHMPMLNFTNLRNEVIVPPPIDFHGFYRLKH